MPFTSTPPLFPPAAPAPGSPPDWRQVALRGPAVDDRPRYHQATIDDLGTPLAEVTFVVVDLETTGGLAQGQRDHRDRRGEGARR